MRCCSSPPPWETARKRDEFDLFPIVNFGEKSKTKSRICTNKTKDLTLGERKKKEKRKKPIPRVEM